MKRILLTTVSLGVLGLLSPAFGADLPTYSKAPSIAAPVYDWTGAYIGVFGGGGYGNHNVNDALGTNTPFAGVLDAVEEHQAEILGISATVLSNVPNVVRLVESVRAKAGRPIRILVGGSAFRSAPLLYREIGADGCGFDLRSALALVNGAPSKESETGSGGPL